MRAGDLEVVKKYRTGSLNISFKDLTSLEGCSETIYGAFNCANNQLTSFEHFPKYLEFSMYIENNRFTSFKNIDQHIEFIGGGLFASGMNITSGYSDLFCIDVLYFIRVDNKYIEEIVNKYLLQKDLIEFQDEMIKVGFESYL